MLAGGVALYATNEFLTISLMPSAVAEIGGQRFYAWVTSVYLVASVVTATTVNPVLLRLGPRWSYLLALSVFGAGSVVCALAPLMPVLLVGRTLQGAGGGLLAGLGYAVINAALPRALWTRASALVSAMWGVGTLTGPTTGGLFAQVGLWRWAFGALVVATAAMAALLPAALPARAPHETAVRRRLRIPWWSLVLLGAAALAVSVAGIPHNPWLTAVLVVLGAVLVVSALVVDRSAGVSVLPPTAYRPGPLKWVYVTLGVLMAATMVDMYVPLFGQRLGHLAPLAAGFLGVALSVGWTAGEIGSASLSRAPVISRVVGLAPLAMAAGLAVAAVGQVAGARPALVAVWAVALLVAGAGIGVAWPHLSAWAMGGVEDPAEGGTAAAAISTVQLICGAFGAGLAGVVVNLTDDGGATPARFMFAVFAGLAALGGLASLRARAAGSAR